MKVKEIMRVLGETILPETTVEAAIARMRSLGIPSLPVVDGEGSFRGMATEADLTRLLGEGKATASDPVHSYLRGSIVTATPEMNAARLAEMMRDRALRHILVVEARHLVGEVSLEEIPAGG